MISVCIATYNGEKYIKEQVLSILSQLGSNDEVIISDDHSQDKTLKLLDELGDSRIKIFLNNRTNKGYTNNFQNSLIHSTGDFIFLSDQDDVWCDNKLLVTMKKLKNFDFVVSNALFVNDDLNSLGTTFFDIRGGNKKSFLSNLIKSKYLGCCIAFRKELLDKALPFPKNTTLCPHDLWLSLIGSFFYKTYVINDCLLLYRRHNENVSSGGFTSKTSFFFKIKFRLYSLFNVLLRFFK